MDDQQERIEQWWAGLTEAQREQAKAHTEGPLPADLMLGMTGAGLLVVGAYWPETQPGPTFEMPDAVAEYVREQDN